MLLHLSAITLTCFVTHELKSCQELVILPALNTDKGRGGGVLVNVSLLKMLSASSAQQVALIGSCTYPSLVNLSLWRLKDCPAALASATCPANNLEMKGDAITLIGCLHVQSIWQLASEELSLWRFESCFSVQTYSFPYFIGGFCLEEKKRKINLCFRSAKIFSCWGNPKEVSVITLIITVYFELANIKPIQLFINAVYSATVTALKCP